MIDHLRQDIIYGFRAMRKAPVFTAVAVFTLALGIGANTAIFSIVNAVLLRPLSYKNCDQLVMIGTAGTHTGSWSVNPPTYSYLKGHNTVFTDIGVFGNSTWPANLTGNGDAERLQGFKVSANLFSVLGVVPELGRTFTSEEDSQGNNRVVVISHELWQRSFGADNRIIGRSIILNGADYKIIGVMPSDFRLVLKTEVWTPLAFTAAEANDSNGESLHAVARRKPGISNERARAELDTLLRRHLSDAGTPNQNVRAQITQLQTILMEGMDGMLTVLFAAVDFVLLIACVNVANLLLARASVRRREIAIRAALGATRLRIIRQLLVESAMLGVLGGTCGLVLTNWCIRFLVNGLPDWVAAKNSHVATLTLDRWALGYTFALSLLTTIIFGLVPALQTSKVTLAEALGESGGISGQGRGQNRLRSIFVVSEIALAMVLLTGAGLMIKSFWQLSYANRGFQSDNVLTVRLDPAGDRYRHPDQVAAFYQQLLERISTIPGVQYAGITNGFLDSGGTVAVAEHSPVPEEQRPIAACHPVSPDYFRAMSIPLRAGRFFTDRDLKDAPQVAIVDEILARRDFPDENPIGKHIRFRDVQREIIGVVGSTKAWKPFSVGAGEGKDEPFARVYIPYSQQSDWSTMALIVRTQSEDPMKLVTAIRHEVAGVDKEQPIHSFMSMNESVAQLRSDHLFSTALMSSFAALAAVLAAVGIYGVTSYTVAQRTHEIGVRMALGAQRRDVLLLVLRLGALHALVGVGIGLGIALTLFRVVRSLLFGLSDNDPRTIVSVALLLVAVAVLACWIPAQRATKVDPMVALRYE